MMSLAVEVGGEFHLTVELQGYAIAERVVGFA
jgi:hypothetical protein